jgi:predicted O-methyltransferase YrrM
VFEPAAASVVQVYRIGDVEPSIADASGSLPPHGSPASCSGTRMGQGAWASPAATSCSISERIGLFAIFIAKTHPDVRAIAIESDPVNFQNLCENIARNNVSNVVTCKSRRDQ